MTLLFGCDAHLTQRLGHFPAHAHQRLPVLAHEAAGEVGQNSTDSRADGFEIGHGHSNSQLKGTLQ